MEALQMLCPGCVSHGLPQATRIQQVFGDDVAVLGRLAVLSAGGRPHGPSQPASLKAGGCRAPEGRVCVQDGLEWYRVDNYDRLDPFLVNVTGSGDLWLFASSTGALTAGRRSAEHALFAYETDDRLHRSGGRTGPFTIVRVGGGAAPWEPFAPHAPYGKVPRSLAKTLCGDRLTFEEHNPDLGLTFRYTWATAADHGLVRTCELVASADASPSDVELLDGLIDVLPAGVELETQQASSTLVDAYRRSEFDPTSGLALFTLEALVSDLSDPAESLLASVVWSRGLDNSVTAMSDRQIRSFRSGKALEPEHRATGVKGAFLVSATARVSPESPLRWTIVADVDRDHVEVSRLRGWLRSTDAATSTARAAVDRAHDELIGLVSQADALQQTADRGAVVSHLTNVTHNCMRGGVPLDDHRVILAEAGRFVASRNRAAAARFEQLTGGMDAVVELDDLRDEVSQDATLTRLVNEGILLRWGELGLRVEDGCLRFAPVLLDPAEFLAAARPWPPLGDGGSLEPGTLGFTYCGSPVVYHLDRAAPWTRATLSGGETATGVDRLDRGASQALFARVGAVTRIDVGIASAQLFPVRSTRVV